MLFRSLEIRNQFNRRLILEHQTNFTLKQTIKKFEKINEGSPGLFSYYEISAEGIVKKLSLIESDPHKIWTAFETCYGHSFFLDVIKETFGLIPTVNNKFAREFNEKLLQYQKDASEQINKLVDRFASESTNLKNEMRRKNEEIDELCRTHNKDLEVTRNMLEKAFENKLQDKETALQIVFNSEKEGLIRKMNDQEVLITELSSNKTLNRLRLRLAVIH